MNPQDSNLVIGSIKGDKLYIDSGSSAADGLYNLSHLLSKPTIAPENILIISIAITLALFIAYAFIPERFLKKLFPFNLVSILNNSIKNFSNVFLDMSDIGKKPVSETTKVEFDQYLIKEYQSASTTRKVFTNIFVICSLAMILWVIFLSKDSSIESRVSIGAGYLGMASFIIFIIRSCYSRTSVILAINEDFHKQKQISNYIRYYKKNSEMNEHDVEIIKEMYQSRAEREKQPKPPTDIVLKNISDSSLNIIGKKGIVKGHKGRV